METLSEGQQSLFYFALAVATYDLERRVAADKVAGFRADGLRIPALTIFALEEPENHLSPYYLARIMTQMRSIAKEGGAQAIVTSHSPAVLGRVYPSAVRYCRRDRVTRTSTIMSIRKPQGTQEESKFVRGAMQSFPELYFAKFVLLVEGDSERVVLPRMAAAIDLFIDSSFVALVPIGGRHVQHFWRLLSQLRIPYATLLDLDLGRRGGGFGRIKTTIQRLLECDVPEEALLMFDDGSLLPEEDLRNMHTRQSPEDVDELVAWVDSLRDHCVFFSSPLDFDLMMLAAYPEAYRAIEPEHGGPRLTESRAAEVVLGSGASGIDMYQGAFAPLLGHLPQYRYHFTTRSKPATHLEAMTRLTRDEISGQLPEPLMALLQCVAKNIRRG